MMARKVSGKSKLLFSGILLGGLIGAVTALLTAPQSGVRTRRKIRERSLDIRDRTTDTIDESIYRAERALADVRARMDDMSNKARRQAEDFVRRSEKELDKQRARLDVDFVAFPVYDGKRAGHEGVDVRSTPTPLTARRSR
jgi:gas vesicle protein